MNQWSRPPGPVEASGPPPGRVVPLARYAAVVLGTGTAVVLAANPATRGFA